MTEIKLVAFDLDGTTLPMMGNEPSERFCRAVTQAAAHGVICAPFTGRSLTTIPALVLALPCRYLSYSNGAGIYDQETSRFLYRSLMPLETCLSILRYLQPFDLPVQVFCDGAILLARYMVENPQRYRLLPHHLRSIAEGSAIVVEDMLQYLQDKRPNIDKINIASVEGAARQQIIATLEQNPRLSVVSSGGINLEMNDICTSKGNALCFLAEQLGIPMSQVMALGDNDNDASMLSVAGYGMVVENGSPAAKAAARYHTAPQDADGAAIAIEQYILEKQTVAII